MCALSAPLKTIWASAGVVIFGSTSSQPAARRKWKASFAGSAKWTPRTWHPEAKWVKETRARTKILLPLLQISQWNPVFHQSSECSPKRHL